MTVMSYTEALRETLRMEMENDPDVLLMGEDIGCYGGAFGVTRGLLDAFGPERVINTPISEGSFVGAAVGAALVGSRPVVEIMFMDFITLAADQLVNQAAKLHYVFGKQCRCPLVVRAAGGAGRCYGPTHSQTLAAWFAQTPGIKVVAPGTAADAAGLLRAALRDDNPVLVVEHKLLYPTKGEVPDDRDFHVPIGRSAHVRQGDDLTIVAWSWMRLQAEMAAEDLEEADVHVDLIDPRTLNPLDMEPIVESVKRTGRILLVEESCRSGGISAEIGFRVFEQVYDYLDAPIKRLTAPDIPIPAGPALESAALPDRDKIVNAAMDLMNA